jgi:hypothetical protein
MFYGLLSPGIDTFAYINSLVLLLTHESSDNNKSCSKDPIVPLPSAKLVAFLTFLVLINLS